jgi:hypothetical protein
MKAPKLIAETSTPPIITASVYIAMGGGMGGWGGHFPGFFENTENILRRKCTPY